MPNVAIVLIFQKNLSGFAPLHEGEAGLGQDEGMG
jgi:hypothetical protein